MKIIAVGDIHGRDTWKRVAEKESDFDRFVFVGDYFDNWPPMTTRQIVENFKDILAFKKKHGVDVIVCIGNHDFQYMPASGGTERYSGYNELTQMQLDAMGKWWVDLQPAYQNDDILFSHAGLTKTWAEANGVTADESIAAQIADIFYRTPEAFTFFPEDRSFCGEHVAQSPFWVRPQSLLSDPFPGIRMVVGHTHSDTVETHGPITMVDTGRGDESYLKIIDGVMSIEML